MPTGEEDISPYATFHLLGMREEAAKNGQAGGMNNPANFQTMPHPPQQQQQQAGMMAGTMGQAPQTPRHASQTMNVRRVIKWIKTNKCVLLSRNRNRLTCKNIILTFFSSHDKI